MIQDRSPTPPCASCVWCDEPLTSEGLCQSCFDKWPKCAVPACQNKCCLRLNSKFCWPHTPGSASEAADSLDDEDMLTEDEGEDTNVEDSYAR